MKETSNKPIKVLLVEDNPGDARLLQEMLAEKASFDLERVVRLSAGLEQLAAGEIDVVLLDLSLPDSRGFDTFAQVQAKAPQVPIVVLSGLDDKALAVKAVREGAQDYLVKGQIDGNLLVRAIRYAIERKQVGAEIRRRATHLEALNAVIAAAAAASSLPDLLQTALDHTLQALSLEIGVIWRAGQYVTSGIPMEPDQARAHEAMATGLAIAGSVAVEDWQEVEANDPLLILTPLTDRSDIRACLAVPLLVEERRIGGLAMISREPRHWHADEVALVEAIGQQLGAAAERLRLFQAEREQRALAEALQEAASIVSSTLEADLVLDRILEQVERVVAGDAFNIMLPARDGSVRVARWRGYERAQETEPEVGKEYQIGDIPNLLKMTQTGEPIIIIDTAADPDWIPLEGREWLRSYVGAPIRVSGLTVGFLNVNSTKPGQFNSADAQRLQAFASHAATAIQNARLYRELLNHAEQLERRVQERTAQLQAQYAQLEAILDSSSDGIIVTDGQGEILQTNPIAQTWLSRTLLPEDAARLQEAVHDLAGRAEERPETVLELTGMDLQLSAAPITEPGMDEAAAVIAIHDISHLKALDRMKSRFVSNVSHELRTPITTIKLYAALMQRSPEKWKEYLDVLVQEADRQALLVEDILQISHIDSGRLEMKPRPTPLNELTEMSVLNHRVLAEGQGLTLEHRPAEPEPVALVDPDRVTQVLTNLIANAINYTPEGRKVTISTGQEEAEGRIWATVTVADTGMGIPEEELPHVFERFFRGEQPRAMQVSGSGLGLAIAKEIVELQGGRVTVESEVDAGTSFTVWLPVAD
jgi:signal transduction histidine kinase/DNA-binding response OmpR family regulator